MKRVGQQHAHHGMPVACKNDPVLEGSALPDNPVFKQLQLVQALRRSIGRLFDEVAVVVDAGPVSATKSEEKSARTRGRARVLTATHCLTSSTVGFTMEPDIASDCCKPQGEVCCFAERKGMSGVQQSGGSNGSRVMAA